MRLLEAETSLIKDLIDESQLIGQLQRGDLRVITARHPTLGKLVIVITADGSGAVVEVSE